MPANIQDKILIEDPKTLEERRKVAREFAEQFKISLPILVDTLDDQAEKAFAAWPDRIYVLDAEGKIAYKGGPGPRGFNVAEAAAVLAKLLAEPAPPARAPELPPMIRERLTAMLERAGLAPPEREIVLEAVARKLAVYGPLMDARRALFQLGEEPEAIKKALDAYAAAGKQYAEAVQRTDRELAENLRLGEKPQLVARLAALGLIGVHPAPPFGGVGPGTGRPMPGNQ